ncbi:hypothetical protein BH24BAC1_BH24BAC1_14430 [soil metagenome]
MPINRFRFATNLIPETNQHYPQLYHIHETKLPQKT